MSDIYQITLTTQTGEAFTGKMSRRQHEFTQTGETFTGKMSRRQHEFDNGFVPLET